VLYTPQNCLAENPRKYWSDCPDSAYYGQGCDDRRTLLDPQRAPRKNFIPPTTWRLENPGTLWIECPQSAYAGLVEGNHGEWVTPATGKKLERGQ
jgi:hypothetical protein